MLLGNSKRDNSNGTVHYCPNGTDDAAVYYVIHQGGHANSPGTVDEPVSDVQEAGSQHHYKDRAGAYTTVISTKRPVSQSQLTAQQTPSPGGTATLIAVHPALPSQSGHGTDESPVAAAHVLDGIEQSRENQSHDRGSQEGKAEKHIRSLSGKRRRGVCSFPQEPTLIGDLAGDGDQQTKSASQAEELRTASPSSVASIVVNGAADSWEREDEPGPGIETVSLKAPSSPPSGFRSPQGSFDREYRPFNYSSSAASRKSSAASDASSGAGVNTADPGPGKARLDQLLHVPGVLYEKKEGGVRKVSFSGSGGSPSPGRRGHLSGATRRISQHSRKVSETGLDGPASAVPRRKGSVVTIDQIPQIIEESLRCFIASEALEVASDWVQDQEARVRRVSAFSIPSRRSSAQSDVTFCDSQEALPSLDHYGLQGGYHQRPTLYQLREEPEPATTSSAELGQDLEDRKAEEGDQQAREEAQTAQKKGWIQGVLIRCVLNIFGVMLFLRLLWITGQAGVGLGCVIVLLSSLVTTLTAMSMAAICTNGEVKGGGAYYMISRSLGPEFGGAIGVIFSLANAVAAAMHIVGAAETVRDIVTGQGGAITGDQVNDVRVIGPAMSVLLMAIVLVGLDFETKAQLVLLVILIVAIANFVIGTFLPPSEQDRRVGFVGYSSETLAANFGPGFRRQDGVAYDFFKIFGIFFPSATGILAGANISGDLKNPSSAIPKGTFLAILVTTLVYLTIIWMAGGCLIRDAVGDAADVATNVTLSLAEIQSCVANGTCGYGLMNKHDIMGVASAFYPLLYAGIFSATLSSALASLVSAPKIFQALGKDRLFPVTEFFSKGYGKNQEPRRGYILTFFICAGMTCIGSLDYIAPIISNFFLMSYCLINVACFDAAIVDSPGFRPSFRLYSKWCSLLGALLCAAIMFLIQWWAALVTIVIVAAIYAYVKYKRPDVNWGSSGQAHAYNAALKSTLKLTNVDEHVKNFRPQLLVLTGYPKNRPALVDLAYSITKRQSLLVCAHVFQGDLQMHASRLRSTAAYKWFRNRGLRAFYSTVAAPTVRQGAQVLLQSSGLGKLRPNTLLMGYKENWQTADPRSVHNYVGIIHDAFDLRYGVGILRVPGGLETYKVRDSQLESTDDNEDLDLDIFEDDASIEEEEESAKRDRRRKVSTVFRESPHTDVSLSTFSGPGQGPGRSQAGTVNRGYLPDDSSSDEDEGGDNEEINGAPVKTAGAAGQNELRPLPRGEAQPEAASGPAQSSAGTEAQSGGRAGEKEKESDTAAGSGPLSRVLSSGDTTAANYFRGKQKGTIHVWWLFDDGGLGLLLPHILSTRRKWRDCSLKVFCAGTKMANVEEDHRKMAALLSKLRIAYSDITIVPDIRKKPQRSSYQEFEQMIYKWRLRPGENQDDYPWKVSKDDLTNHKQKIYLQLRIREKLLQNSTGASLIVMTLPVPRRFCPAGLYLTWLETLTRDLPPTLLLRGNQQSVLTYFS